jgi:hypothetical protein
MPMAIITGIIHPVVPQADRLHPQVHQQGHPQASQRDLLHQHPHVHPLPNHPMPPGVLLHRLNPQHQTSLLHLRPDQVRVPVPGAHPVPGVAGVEGADNTHGYNLFFSDIFIKFEHEFI